MLVLQTDGMTEFMADFSHTCIARQIHLGKYTIICSNIGVRTKPCVFLINRHITGSEQARINPLPKGFRFH